MLSGILFSIKNIVPANFNYHIDKNDTSIYNERVSIFKLYKGKAKTDNNPVLIHYIENRKKKSDRFELIYNNIIKNAKKIRHPYLLAVHDVIETNNGTYIITELATPLKSYLQNTSYGKDYAYHSLPWNINSVIQCIRFLHTKVKIIHGSISIDSIFVTSSGQFKLSPLEVGIAIDCNYSDVIDVITLLPLKCLYDKYDKNYLHSSLASMTYNDSIIKIDKIAIESLFAYIIALFKTNNFHLPYDATTNAIHLNDEEQDLLNSISPDFDNNLDDHKYFRSSNVVLIMDFFSTYAIRGNWDKEQFFSDKLPHLLENMNKYTKTILVLSQLSQILIAKDTTPVLKSWSLKTYFHVLSTYKEFSVDEIAQEQEKFQENNWQTLQNILIDEERSIRFLALKYLPQYECILTAKNVISIYDDILNGLSDISVDLRDMTLRSLVYLYPKIAKKIRNVNTKTINTISTIIQKDTSDQVRTNACICLIKLVNPMDPLAKNAAAVLLIAMKDGFAHCRYAALNGLFDYFIVFSKYDLFHKVVPSLGPRVIDTDPKCASLAYDCLIRILSHHVNSLPIDTQQHSKITLPLLSAKIQAIDNIEEKQLEYNDEKEMNKYTFLHDSNIKSQSLPSLNATKVIKKNLSKLTTSQH